MPVTAKLSRKFYEKLGEDVTNELVDWFNNVDATFRAELREMNELNFQRFDARLGERIAEFRGEVKAELAQLEGRIITTGETLRKEFAQAIAELRTSLLKWMFTFWVSALLGLGALFYRR